MIWTQPKRHFSYSYTTSIANWAFYLSLTVRIGRRRPRDRSQRESSHMRLASDAASCTGDLRTKEEWRRWESNTTDETKRETPRKGYLCYKNRFRRMDKYPQVSLCGERDSPPSRTLCQLMWVISCVTFSTHLAQRIGKRAFGRDHIHVRNGKLHRACTSHLASTCIRGFSFCDGSEQEFSCSLVNNIAIIEAISQPSLIPVCKFFDAYKSEH